MRFSELIILVLLKRKYAPVLPLKLDLKCNKLSRRHEVRRSTPLGAFEEKLLAHFTVRYSLLKDEYFCNEH